MNTSVDKALRPFVSVAQKLWRFAPVVAVVLSIGLLLSGVITWINIGLSHDFVARWMAAFATAVPVLPVGFLTMGLLQRVLQPLFEGQPRWLLTVALAVGSALTMETLLSSAVTYSTYGWQAGFAAQWGQAFVRSLPLGFVVGLTMGFVIRPRLMRWIAAQ